MALRPQATLGELRDELAGRLGFGAQVGNLGDLDLTLKSFLRDAQFDLWWQHEFPPLIKSAEKVTGEGQKRYDYPDDCDPNRIKYVELEFGGIWCRLDEGIEYTEDSYEEHYSRPLRYERHDQLKLWPIPDQNYRLRFEYIAYPRRFTADADRATLYDRLVFKFALATAKAHYNHPDAARYQAEAVALLRQQQRGAHGNRRYFAGGDRGDSRYTQVKVVDHRGVR